MGKIKDITGQRFGRLTALCHAGFDGKRGEALWLCRCSCGQEILARGGDLRNEHTKSCGCYNDERRRERSTTHGGTSGGKWERLYGVYAGMIQRCEDRNHRFYAEYGGRGITVCPEWRHNYAAFRDWAYTHGYDPVAPHRRCTIDRINNDGNYSPDNCRIVDQLVQNNNSRHNHRVTYNGETHTLSEWERLKGLPNHILSHRLNQYGWSVDRALNTPARNQRSKYTA